MSIDVPIPFDHPFREHDLSAVETLRKIMAALREPETGCPWDVEQDFSSIAPYTLEEAYEVADAIQRSDMPDLREELGDLLLQVVYHAQMAAEVDEFTFDDVVRGVCMKMIRRHPHVFGDDETRSAGIAKEFWETIKAAEKKARGKPEAQGILDGVPLPLPSLTRAGKLQKKAAKVGFDWPDAEGPYRKIQEELAEVQKAATEGTKKDLQVELGDLLFSVVNFARHHDLDPEEALRQSNAKFMKRFAFVEARIRENGGRIGETGLAEMDALWNEAKSRER